MKTFLKYFLVLGLFSSCAAMTSDISTGATQSANLQVFGTMTQELRNQKPWWGKTDLYRLSLIYPIGPLVVIPPLIMELTCSWLIYGSDERKRLKVIRAIEDMLGYSDLRSLKFAATEQDILAFTQQFKHLPIYSTWVYLEKFYQKMDNVRQQLSKIEKNKKLHEIINAMMVATKAYQDYLSKHQDFKIQQTTYEKAVEENKIRKHVRQTERRLHTI